MLISAIKIKKLSPMLVILIMITASCSNKTYIAQDFWLTDLGGSNQAISSTDGSISLYPVTAYLVRNNLIFVEVEENHLSDKSQKKCLYSVIFIDKKKIHKINNESRFFLEIQSILKKKSNYINTRTCLH